MNEEEKDGLWELLGRARPAPEAPRLAEHVLRRIRTEPVPDRAWPAILLRWIFPAAAACSIGLALLLPGTLSRQPSPQLSGSDYSFEEIAELDTLVSSSAGWAWSEVAP
jgi:hypothetical protein